MQTAKAVASDLFKAFASKGLLNASCLHAIPGDSLIPASTDDVSVSSWVADDSDFASIAVQSISYAEKSKTVYVHVSKGNMRKLSMLKKEINGVSIVIKKISPLIINPEKSLSSTNSGNIYLIGDEQRRACGSSCSPSNVTFAGTMGAIIRQNDVFFLLSNNHVIGGCNHARFNSIIMSPAMSDSISGIAPIEIGRLSKLSPLSSGNPHFVNPCDVDAALARVTYPDRLTSWQGSEEEGYDTPSQITEITDDDIGEMRVKKFGRTTGLTYGTVHSYCMDYTQIAYKANGFNATVYFDNFFFIEGDERKEFASCGDSGSLVVTEDESAAVGIIFATSPGYGCMLPINQVLNSLGGGELASGYGLPTNDGNGSDVATSESDVAGGVSE